MLFLLPVAAVAILVLTSLAALALAFKKAEETFEDISIDGLKQDCIAASEDVGDILSSLLNALKGCAPKDEGDIAQGEVVLDSQIEFDQQDQSGTWVAAADYQFIIGQNNQVICRLVTPPPGGAVVNWVVTPQGLGSGTVAPITTQARDLTFVPTVNVTQRPVGGSRVANAPVEYVIAVSVQHNGRSESNSVTIRQDETSIIRQEYLDFQLFVQGFNLAIPSRAEVVVPTNPNWAANFSNYTLIVDRGALNAHQATQQVFGAQVDISSLWRNPRRNRAVNGVTNSLHQTGQAVDMVPANAAAPGTPARRFQFLALYRATMNANAAGNVLLERRAVQLLQGRWNPPQPNALDPDLDGDGLPDNSTGGPGFPRNLGVIFDDATHVHWQA